MHTMKLFILFVVINLVIATAGFQAVCMTGGQAAVTKSSPGWYIVFEEKVASANTALFMKTQREVADLWKRQYPNVTVFSCQNDDNTLYRVIPIYSFASVDTLYRKMEQVSVIMKTGGYGRDEKIKNLSTVTGTVMIWMPELSHQGKEFSLYSDKPFAEWMFVYLLPDQELEAAEALRRFRDYYAENKLDYPWNTYRVVLGTDTPVLIGMFRDQSPASLQEKGRKIWEKHGTELEKLWGDVVRHTRRIEKKTGWFNPSLSNIPLMESAQKEGL